MRQKTWWIVTGLAAFAFFLFWNAPAGQFLGLINQKIDPGLHLSALGTTGSWRQGRCRWLQAGGFTAREVRWRINPLSLLSGELSASVSGRILFKNAFHNEPAESVPVQGSLTVKPDGRYRINGYFDAEGGGSVPPLFGKPDSSGRIQFSRQGRLPLLNP